MLNSIQLPLAALAAFFSLANGLPAAAPAAPLRISNVGVDAAHIIPNSYIVVMNSSAEASAVESFMTSMVAKVSKRNLNTRDITGKRTLSTKVETMNMGAWRCMTLEADDATVNELDADPNVAYVEANTRVFSSVLVEQQASTPGLARISHAAVGATNYVFDDTAGQGITVYVVDTGVKASHAEFAGRATLATNTVDTLQDDGNGHGSHVSGTIAGTTFGVAKSATIMGVKVLGTDGSGSNAGVLKGLDFVAKDAVGKRAVMNMSLGGPQSNAVNTAVNALSAQGVIPVVAAGNEAQDTANTSPGSANGAITVGAADQRDKIAVFSNFGPDVDMFASGVDVLSVGILSNTDTKVLSGTSMASPHVAGLAAALMSQDPTLVTMQQVLAKMQQLAGLTGAKVTGITAAMGNTTTLIAYNGSGQ